MAKLYFSYATMNAGKSTMLLQASYNYQERGMRVVMLIAAHDDRGGLDASPRASVLALMPSPFTATTISSR